MLGYWARGFCYYDCVGVMGWMGLEGDLKKALWDGGTGLLLAVMAMGMGVILGATIDFDKSDRSIFY